MKLGNFRRRTKCTRQEGYLLIVLMLMVTLVAFSIMATAPDIATQIKRDREVELVHRGAQYARAIKKFYKKFGRYPVSIAQLENTNNIRFLRRRYKDPINGKDFKLLHFGDVKLMPKAPGSATGPGVPVAQPSGSTASGPLSTSPTSSSPFGSLASPIQSSPAAETPQQPEAGTAGSSAESPKSSGASDSSSSSSAESTGSSGSDSSSSSSVFGGATLGAGPIVGVTSFSDKQSLMEFNDKNHYNQWEFIYDPTMDRGGLITGPYVPNQAGASGVLPGGIAPVITGPQTGLGQPIGGVSPAGQPSGTPEQQGPK